MKNSVLAPVIALLVVLAIVWTGLFGLSRASSMAAEQRQTSPTAPATRDTSSSPDVVADGPAPPDPAPQRESRENAGTGDDARSTTERSTTERTTTERSTTTDEEEPSFVDRFTDGESARERPAGDDSSFLDRRSERETSGGTAAGDGTRDSDGLTNRGATALLLVLVLIAAAGAKRH